jgi:hypothetical protein
LCLDGVTPSPQISSIANLFIAVTVTDSLSRVAKTKVQLEDSILIGLVTPKGAAHGT